jgi:plasmid stabilization system protein ParE
MSWKLLIRPAAFDDLEATRNWYELRQSGLGDRFLDCADETIARIVEQPLWYNIVHRDIRRTTIHRFPYGVYYRVLEDTIHVIAIFHGRQSSKRLRDRLKERPDT